MKFKFKTQPYQQDAVSNICRVFKGQPYHDMVRYTRDLGIRKKKNEEQIDMVDTGAFGVDDNGFENANIVLDDAVLFENIKNIQIKCLNFFKFYFQFSKHPIIHLLF